MEISCHLFFLFPMPYLFHKLVTVLNKKKIEKNGEGIDLPSTYSASLFPSLVLSLKSDSSEEEHLCCTLIPMCLLSEADGM